jgi:hypothetical protein
VETCIHYCIPLGIIDDRNASRYLNGSKKLESKKDANANADGGLGVS